jgi:hypothetical protein
MVFALLVIICASAALGQLEQFVAFKDAVIVQASYRNLTANATQCGSECVQDVECVSFNILGESCELNSYGVTYSELKSPGNSYYHRIKLRNDQPATQAIPFIVSVWFVHKLPTQSVKLHHIPLHVI